MPAGRLDRILGRLAMLDLASTGTSPLCVVCAEVTEMSGAGIMLMDGDLPRGSLCTSDEVSALIEDLQYTLGEGPCIDAYQQQRPVKEPDLADPAVPRWTAFTPPAVAAGAGAVFGFPLELGAARIGALNLYRDRPGPMTADQHADALLLATVAARLVIELRPDATSHTLDADPESGANFQFVVHQASGMVAAQLGVSVTDALTRLRAHAFRNGVVVADVARRVVGRELRFDVPEDPTPPSG